MIVPRILQEMFWNCKCIIKIAVGGKTKKYRHAQNILLRLLQVHRVAVFSFIESVPKSNNYETNILTKTKIIQYFVAKSEREMDISDKNTGMWGTAERKEPRTEIPVFPRALAPQGKVRVQRGWPCEPSKTIPHIFAW